MIQLPLYFGRDELIRNNDFFSSKLAVNVLCVFIHFYYWTWLSAFFLLDMISLILNNGRDLTQSTLDTVALHLTACHTY